jgi:hypothetical protein
VLAHVTPELELEEIAADDMDFDDLPRADIGLKPYCTEQDL